ncbi:hypothetical protein ACFT5B_00215 [Luteimicrobium sp. NPDC057192]|uniref:hypothetical protein n=1 Tax=Luteimicrobium sp. NPDC057192 TaxID=3346042 RepID=UPI00362CD090
MPSTRGVVVDLKQLEAVTNHLLAALRAEVGDEVEVTEFDYFWSVPHDARNEVLEDPPELTIGQVSFSLDDLQEREPDRISYELVWLSEVLPALAKAWDRATLDG